MPGPSSSTTKRTPPSGRGSTERRTSPSVARVLDRVASTLRSACASRSGSAWSIARRDRHRARSDAARCALQLEELGDERLELDRLGACRKRASSVRARSSRSSTSREPSGRSPRHQPLDPADLLGAGSAVRASTSSWPAQAASGVRSSCEASARNDRCRANASSRRSSMWLNASARTRTSSGRRPRVDPRAQIAGVDPRGDRAPCAAAAGRSGRPGVVDRSATASVRPPAIRNVCCTPSWARCTARAARRRRDGRRPRRGPGRARRARAASHVGTSASSSRSARPAAGREDVLVVLGAGSSSAALPSGRAAQARSSASVGPGLLEQQPRRRAERLGRDVPLGGVPQAAAARRLPTGATLREKAAPSPRSSWSICPASSEPVPR